MERVLGKKQSIQNEEWLKAEKRIEELVSREVPELFPSGIIHCKTRGLQAHIRRSHFWRSQNEDIPCVISSDLWEIHI